MNNKYLYSEGKYYIFDEKGNIRVVSSNDNIDYILEMENNIEKNEKRLNHINSDLPYYSNAKIISSELPIYTSFPVLLSLGAITDYPILGLILGSYSTISFLHLKYNNYNTLNNLRKIRERMLKEKTILESCLEFDKEELSKLKEESNFKEEKDSSIKLIRDK